MSDMDQFHHMSFANYLKLVFLTTDALLMPCYGKVFFAQNRLRLIHSKVQFKKPTAVGDNILIKVNSADINADQFSLVYTFVIDGSEELVALVRQRYSIYGQCDEKPKKIPDSIKNILTPINVNENNLI